MADAPPESPAGHPGAEHAGAAAAAERRNRRPRRVAAAAGLATSLMPAPSELSGEGSRCLAVADGKALACSRRELASVSVPWVHAPAALTLACPPAASSASAAAAAHALAHTRQVFRSCSVGLLQHISAGSYKSLSACEQRSIASSNPAMQMAAQPRALLFEHGARPLGLSWRRPAMYSIPGVKICSFVHCLKGSQIVCVSFCCLCPPDLYRCCCRRERHALRPRLATVQRLDTLVPLSALLLACLALPNHTYNCDDPPADVSRPQRCP